MNEAPSPLDRLSFWAAAAAVLSLGASIVMLGVSFSTLITGVLLTILLLPAMLILRAVLAMVRGLPSDLYVGDRVLLPGAFALVAPLLALASVSGLRELGFVTANLYAAHSQTQQTSSSMRSNGQLMDPPTLPTGLTVVDRGGLQVFAAESLLNETLIACIPQISSLTGYVQVEVETPSAWMPFWKRTELAATVHGVLQLQQTGEKTRLITSNWKVTIDGTWAMTGIASQRDFHVYLGTNLGKACSDALLDEVKLMREM